MNLKILEKISYGMYIVSSKKNDKINGQIANSVFQITSTPARVAISINKHNLMSRNFNVFCRADRRADRRADL
ncbi:MAG: flavin reductase [Elusimicrobiota bacterium]